MGEPVDASAEAEAFASSNLFRRADIHWLTCEGALMGMWKSAHGRIAVKEQHRRVQRPFLSTRRVLQTRERGWGSGGGLRLGLAAGLCSHGGASASDPSMEAPWKPMSELSERLLNACCERLIVAAIETSAAALQHPAQLLAFALIWAGRQVGATSGAQTKRG